METIAQKPEAVNEKQEEVSKPAAPETHVNSEIEPYCLTRSLDLPRRHPLNNSWTLWFFLNDKSIKWEDSQVEVSTFDTVEDFWALFNHIENASRLKPGCDYSLFKTGIKPMWEDNANVQGGKWTCTLAKQQRNTDLDNMFLELVMMLIGENEDMEAMNQVTGIVCSLRQRADRLAVWTRTCNTSNGPGSVLPVGRCIRKLLDLPRKTLEFTRHADQCVKRGSTVRVIATL